MTASAIDWARGLLRRKAKEEAPAKETTGGSRRSGDPVEVYRAANDLEAQVVKGFLESNGIPVALRGEALGTTLAVSVGHLAEVSVLVPEALAPRALELLESQVQEQDEAADQGDQE